MSSSKYIRSWNKFEYSGPSTSAGPEDLIIHGLKNTVFKLPPQIHCMFQAACPAVLCFPFLRAVTAGVKVALPSPAMTTTPAGGKQFPSCCGGQQMHSWRRCCHCPTSGLLSCGQNLPFPDLSIHGLTYL